MKNVITVVLCLALAANIVWYVQHGLFVHVVTSILCTASLVLWLLSISKMRKAQ